MTNPDWWRGAVIYQIYPRSFSDSNGDGVGDLPGIIGRLDHIASLGVDGIWLSPFFRSPMRDFGYDVSDYRDVDPVFGTLEDFDALLAEAHARGLRVIIDQVYSHTSSDHPWFAKSALDPSGPFADWYVWADPRPDGSPPNNWLSVFGGPAWTFHPARRAYYLHNFLSTQPDLNFHNPAVQDEVLDIARFWLDRGVDGFRLDVANYYAHDLELRDNPPRKLRRTPAATYLMQQHLFDKSRPETLDFLGRLRRLTDTYPARMMVGELGDDDELARQKEYTAGPERLHTAYSFHLLNATRPTAALFRTAVDAWRGADGWPSWSLGNHDVSRYPSRLGGDVPTAPRALLGALFAMKGAVFLYQGDELGLSQGRVAFEQLKDPYSARSYVGDSFRDGARTPMPWTSDPPFGGFTDGSETWLPVDPAHLPLVAAAQSGDPSSLLNWVRSLIAARKVQPALAFGEAETLDAPEPILLVLRTAAASRVICAVNLGPEPATVRHPLLVGARPVPGLASAAPSDDRLELAPWACAYLEVSERDR